MRPDDTEDDVLQAVYDVFTRDEAGRLALRWLCLSTGFMTSLPPGASDEARIEHNSYRRLFGTIVTILRVSEEGREALSEAYRPGLIEPKE